MCADLAQKNNCLEAHLRLLAPEQLRDEVLGGAVPRGGGLGSSCSSVRRTETFAVLVSKRAYFSGVALGSSTAATVGLGRLINDFRAVGSFRVSGRPISTLITSGQSDARITIRRIVSIWSAG